jgi:hypothetical protein
MLDVLKLCFYLKEKSTFVIYLMAFSVAKITNLMVLNTIIYLSIYLSGLVTAVAVFRNSNTIPFCVTTSLNKLQENTGNVVLKHFAPTVLHCLCATCGGYLMFCVSLPKKMQIVFTQTQIEHVAFQRE